MVGFTLVRGSTNLYTAEQDSVTNNRDFESARDEFNDFAPQDSKIEPFESGNEEFNDFSTRDPEIDPSNDVGDDYGGSDLGVYGGEGATSGENAVDFSEGEDPENYGYAGSDDPENYGYAGSDDPENYGYGEGPPVQEQNESETPSQGGARGNPLNPYPNYTYGIALHYMTLSEYNGLQQSGNYEPSGGKALVVSGGRRRGTDARHPLFDLDMYFENLKLSCIIGLNARSRGSNVIMINFTIVEPYGMSFLDKLIKIARENDIKAWEQMPLVLQIDFFANKTDGSLQSPIQNLTKYICIKIIEMKIKVSTKGTEYGITAVPHSHVGFTQTVVTTPIDIEVLAKNVGEFFGQDGGGGPEPAGSNEMESQNEAYTERGDSVADDESTGGAIGAGGGGGSGGGGGKNYSFVSALNAHQKLLVERKHQEKADTYEFKIDSEIAKAEIIKKVSRATGSWHNVPNKNDENTKNSVELEKVLVRQNAGTAITEVINAVLRNSKYYEDQVKESEPPKGNKPIKSHKILTTVTYQEGEWDSKRKVFARKITYHIKKYSYWNDKFPKAERGVPKEAQKQYFYLFTGKNQDILDIDIDFNTMFYTSFTAFEQKEQYNKAALKDEKTEPKAEPDTNLAKGTDNSIQPLKTVPRITSKQESANNYSVASAKTVESADMQKSMMSSSRGDMLNIMLKIAGDPDLIKQDDTFYPPGKHRGSSIPMNDSEIFAKLEFKVPEDLNQSTGLMNFDKRAVFSGIFRIMKVDCLFDRGQFTQTLDLIRMFDQDSPSQGGNEREDAGLNDESFLEDEYGEGGDLIGGDDYGDDYSGMEEEAGSMDEAFADDEYGEGGEYLGSPGDESVAGFDYADGGPGDASVAGIDVYSPGDPSAAGIDYVDSSRIDDESRAGIDSFDDARSSPEEKNLQKVLRTSTTRFIDL